MGSSYAGCYIGQTCTYPANNSPTCAACSFACSPGIPCTGYEIDNPADSGTDPEYNGRKTGVPLNDPSDPSDSTTLHDTGSCDGNFMNQIYARAYMHASREVIMAGQLIHKPDSVLEYTCFDKQIGLAAHHGATFSESRKWESMTITISTGDDDSTESSSSDYETTINDSGGGSRPAEQQDDFSVFADDRLDTVLSEFLLDTLEDYINNNFDHTFMGGALSIDNDMNLTSITDGSYSCSHMNLVWEIARCFDFADEDRFRHFGHFVNYDPRSIPRACSAGHISNDSVDAGTGGDKIDDRSTGQSIPTSLTALQNSDNDSGLTNPDATPPPSPPALPNTPVPYEECPTAGGPVGGVNTGFSNDLIRVANNCDDGTLEHAYASYDMPEMYFNIMKGIGSYIPGSGVGTQAEIDAGTVVRCNAPIPTGVPVTTVQYGVALDTDMDHRVVNRDSFFHYDHVCPNAGCFYVPIKIPYDPTVPIWDLDVFVGTHTAGTCLPYIP
ncbi:MAG: hypothetical protein ACRBDL_11590 [Alphaproteobacteria bacterium]